MSGKPWSPLSNSANLSRFEQLILPHLDAAYHLARWITGNEQDARDVVQEACLRAFRAFDRFNGDNGRPWLLTIVRNTAYSAMQKNRALTQMTPFDEEIHCQGETARANDATPATVLHGAEDEQRLVGAIAALPAEFREAIVLRHQDGLSYKEIAQIAGVPTGTVMSRLARARARLKQLLAIDERPEAAS